MGAKVAGASVIVAVDLNDGKLEHGQAFGATHACKPDELDSLKASLTGGDGFDYSFEAIGLPSTMRASYDAIRRGGTACIVGVGKLDEFVSFSAFELFFSEKILVGSYYGSADVRTDFHKLLGFYKDGSLPLADMITRRIKLDEINDAFGAMAARRGHPPGHLLLAREVHVADDSGVLSAPLIIEYPFSRTTGPVIGAFLTGLREQVLIGIRARDGKVIVPPTEYDPHHRRGAHRAGRGGSRGRGGHVGLGAAADAEAPPPGAVRLGARAARRRRRRLPAAGRCRLDRRACPRACGSSRAGRPTARARSTTSSAGSPHERATSRCRHRWRASSSCARSAPPRGWSTRTRPGWPRPASSRGSPKGRSSVSGRRAGRSTSPPAAPIPQQGVPTTEQVDLPHVGTLVSFCVVNVAFYGQGMEIPYTSGLILLDGADLAVDAPHPGVPGGGRPHRHAGRGRVGRRRRSRARTSRASGTSVPTANPTCAVTQPGEGVTW